MAHLIRDLSGKRVYICSPLNSSKEHIMAINQDKAGFLAKKISREYNCLTIAPHSFLPDILDDNDPEQRKIAIEFGLKLLDTCDCIVVCGNIFSKGMKQEIHYAKRHNIKIFYYSTNLLNYLMEEYTEEEQCKMIEDKQEFLDYCCDGVMFDSRKDTPLRRKFDFIFAEDEKINNLLFNKESD